MSNQTPQIEVMRARITNLEDQLEQQAKKKVWKTVATILLIIVACLSTYFTAIQSLEEVAQAQIVESESRIRSSTQAIVDKSEADIRTALAHTIQQLVDDRLPKLQERVAKQLDQQFAAEITRISAEYSTRSKELKDAVVKDLEDTTRLAEATYGQQSQRLQARLDALAELVAEIDGSADELEHRLQAVELAVTGSAHSGDEIVQELSRLQAEFLADTRPYPELPTLSPQAWLAVHAAQPAPGVVDGYHQLVRTVAMKYETLMQPFFTAGLWQPGQTVPGKERPMSLGAMKAAGALDPGERGITNLVAVATHRQNERPGWEQYSGGSKSRVWYEREDGKREVPIAHKLLTDFGDALVAIGCLSE